jgi:hypothetical protein
MSNLNDRIAELLNTKKAERLVKNLEKELTKNYKLSLKEIKVLIADLFARYGEQVTWGEIQQYNRLKNLEGLITEQIKILTKQNTKTARGGLKEIYQESYYQTGYAHEATLNLSMGFGKLNPNAISGALINNLDVIKWEERLKAHAQTYIRQIREELAQGLIQGKGYAKIAKGLNDKTEIGINKAIRIVRTEGHRVQSAARVDAIEKVKKAGEKFGFTIQRIWLSTLDGRTRDTHRSMDNTAEDDSGYFTLPSGIKAIAPGLSGIAEEDINCRCTTITKVNDYTPQTRVDNTNSNQINFISYQDWADKKGI